jgi:DHA1 family inner membrane transport protein
VINVILLTSVTVSRVDTAIPESIYEDQFPTACPGDWRFRHRYDRIFPMGLLPVIAQGVDVSIPAAGMLISAYAIGVMVGAPLMTLLLSHRGRRNALVFLMAIFTLGNVLSALSPDYTTLMLSRIITSLNHGAFFGLGSVVAASVVAKEKQASAVATMFMGLTIANIGGVPAATWLGGAIGWRMSFLATAGLGYRYGQSLLFLAERQRRRTS